MSESGVEKKRIGTWHSLLQAMTSWRTGSVCLLSFSSGLPLGLVWFAIPDWMRDIGVDIRVVGLTDLRRGGPGHGSKVLRRGSGLRRRR